MLWEVDVSLRDSDADHAARAVVAGAAELGIPGCTRARTAAGWLIEGEISRADAERLATRLLTDPVTESFTLAEVGRAGGAVFVHGHGRRDRTQPCRARLRRVAGRPRCRHCHHEKHRRFQDHEQGSLE